MKFEVINEGVGGTNTAFILAGLNRNLDKYNPDMVITMMGVNDGGISIIYDDSFRAQFISVIKDLRTYELGKLLWSGLKSIIEADQEGSNVQKAVLVIGIEWVDNNIQLGHDYIEQGRFDEAEELFKEIAKISPNRDEVYAELGQLYRAQGRTRDATEMFEKAIELSPNNYPIHLELGLMYEEQNRLEEAVYPFKRATEIKPHNPMPYSHLSRCYTDLGKLEEAEELLGTAIRADPDNEKTYAGLLDALHSQNLSDGELESLYTIIDDREQELGTTIGRGMAYFEQGRFDEAEELFNQIVNLYPTNDEAYVWLARLYHAQGRVEGATEMVEKALELSPNNYDAHFELGELYEVQQRREEAISESKKAIELRPNDDEPRMRAGMRYKALGMFEEAENAFKKAVELNPADDMAYYQLLLLYHDIYHEKGTSYEEIERVYKDKGFVLEATENTSASDITKNHYIQLHDVLKRRGIRHVAMQYPTRSVDDLKKMFSADEDVTFVSNEENFRQALAEGAYDEYFIDRCYGDLGHATPKGNRLIAENAADAVLTVLGMNT